MVRFMQKPYVEHISIAKKILRYITITKDLSLKYTKLPFFIFSGFSDSDYGGDRDEINLL